MFTNNLNYNTYDDSYTFVNVKMLQLRFQKQCVLLKDAKTCGILNKSRLDDRPWRTCDLVYSSKLGSRKVVFS